jgi:hypothetical protein
MYLKHGSWVVALLMLGGCADSRTKPRAEVELPEAQPSPFAGESALKAVAVSCDDGSTREIALDATLEGAAFTAQDVLAWVERTHVEAIRWVQPLGATVGPESGERALYITVTRASDRAREHVPETIPIGHGTRCEHWLELDVKLALQTDDGALNEAIEGTLYTSDARVAYFHASAGDDAFGGELTIEPISEGGLSRFDLEIVLSPQGVGGALYAVWLVQTADFSYDDPRLFASIGTVDCEPGEFAVGIDERVPLSNDGAGISAQQLLGQAEQLDTLPLTWRDGTRTTAALRFTSRDEGACGSVSSTSPEDAARLMVPGEVTFESADGRVGGTWPAYLEQWGVEGPLALHLARRDDGATVTPPELGFPGLERGELLDLSVSLILHIADGTATGSLALDGSHCGGGSLETGSCNYTTVDLESAAVGE